MDPANISKDLTYEYLQGYTPDIGEVLIAPILLACAIFLELAAKAYYANEVYAVPSIQTTISPEISFRNISQPYKANYMFVNDSRKGWNKMLKVHYLFEKNMHSNEVVMCLHGEPFWSYSYHRVLPYFIKEGFSIIAPDLVGFGRSEKYVDWRAYDLELHKSTIIQLIQHLNLNSVTKNITLVGHNWGFLLGASLMKDHPQLFHRLVILNTNNLPNGELEPTRYKNLVIFGKYLLVDAMFLAFRASVSLLRNNLSPRLLFKAIGNGLYTEETLHAFEAPFQRKKLDRGGFVSFPLMVPIFENDLYSAEFSETREFLSKYWSANRTLVVFSKKTHLPFVSNGDFIVGNRQDFFKQCIRNATIAQIDNAGHVVMHDQAATVASHIIRFINNK